MSKLFLKFVDYGTSQVTVIEFDDVITPFRFWFAEITIVWSCKGKNEIDQLPFASAVAVIPVTISLKNKETIAFRCCSSRNCKWFIYMNYRRQLSD